MRAIAQFAGLSMLLVGCTADPLGNTSERDVGATSFDVTVAAKQEGPQTIAVHGQGFGEVIGCSGPDACEWRFTGTATGIPFDQSVSIVVEISTTGEPDLQGCQAMTNASVSFFRKEGKKKSIGWKLVLNGPYCGTESHFSSGGFRVEPDTPHGPGSNATGSGIFNLTDGVAAEPGATGPWTINLSGIAIF
jgi:hypothetical protein